MILLWFSWHHTTASVWLSLRCKTICPFYGIHLITIWSVFEVHVFLKEIQIDNFQYLIFIISSNSGVWKTSKLANRNSWHQLSQFLPGNEDILAWSQLLQQYINADHTVRKQHSTNHLFTSRQQKMKLDDIYYDPQSKNRQNSWKSLFNVIFFVEDFQSILCSIKHVIKQITKIANAFL